MFDIFCGRVSSISFLHKLEQLSSIRHIFPIQNAWTIHLKRKYGIGVGLSEEREEIPGFIDRAEERRLIHGVDPINAKTETASMDQAIG